MGGAAKARKRRMATEAGVCPRLTATNLRAEGESSGVRRERNTAPDERSQRECQAGCRRCGAISD